MIYGIENLPPARLPYSAACFGLIRAIGLLRRLDHITADWSFPPTVNGVYEDGWYHAWIPAGPDDLLVPRAGCVVTMRGRTAEVRQECSVDAEGDPQEEIVARWHYAAVEALGEILRQRIPACLDTPSDTFVFPGGLCHAIALRGGKSAFNNVRTETCEMIEFAWPYSVSDERTR